MQKINEECPLCQEDNWSFLYFSTHNNFKDLLKLPWVDFQVGMDEWTKQFRHIRKNEIQPSPLSQTKYIFEKILPKLEIKINDQTKIKIYNLLSNYNFTPYYWDREKIWETLKNEISLLSQ